MIIGDLNEADQILFYQWIESQHAADAFQEWKSEQLRTHTATSKVSKKRTPQPKRKRTDVIQCVPHPRDDGPMHEFKEDWGDGKGPRWGFDIQKWGAYD